MATFEYDITKHPAVEFENLVYFCTDQGDCRIQSLPSDQLMAFAEICNERGSDGWELIQIVFGQDGAVAFWKREKKTYSNQE